MRLRSLTLFNFQGIRDLRLDFGGQSASIYGDNGTGKTTVFNAITWLLFDKASTGAKNFSPKTKDAQGKDFNYLEHGVETCFILANGQELTLRKVFKESWKKKRGSTIEEFSGHEVDYFVDGVPAKEKEYIATLTNYIGSSDHLKMLLMPSYFSEDLSWDERRRILLDMCGDVSVQDVIQSNPELEDFLNFLAVPGTADKYYTVDEYKKIAVAKRTDINKEMQTIPARIDEAQKAMPNITNIDISSINLEISELNSQIEAKEEEKRLAIAGNDDGNALRSQLATLSTQLLEGRVAHANANAKANEVVYGEIDRLKNSRRVMENSLASYKGELQKHQTQLENMQKDRQRLFEKYNQVSAIEWKGDEVCPTCERELPEDKINAAIEAFNLSKSIQLEDINKEGQSKCSKEMIASLEAKISELASIIEETERNISSFNTAISDKEKELRQPQPFENTEDFQSIMGQIQSLQNSDVQGNDMVKQLVAPIDTEISNLRTQIDRLMAEKSKLTLAEQQQKRIDELSASEKRLSAEYETLQHGIHLCEEFIKAKVSMLTGNINSKFETVRFRLFNEQINGGIKEDCEVMIPADGRLVPYTFANNAARINAGLEIINVLAKYYGTSIPVFVDNAESITRLQNVDTQLIKLIVSESDKNLRLEVM